MNIPDIVPNSLWVTEEDIHGWSPMIVEEFPEDDADRIFRGLVRPPEMALQLAFGVRNHVLSQYEFSSFEDRFDYGRQQAVSSVKNDAHHEFGYINAIALWHERDAVINYPAGYGDYSSLYDGYRRNLAFSDPSELASELSRNLERYGRYALDGCVNKEEVMAMEGRRFAEETLAQGIEEVAQGLIDGGTFKHYSRLGEEEVRRRAISEAEEIIEIYEREVCLDDQRLKRLQAKLT